MQKNEHEAPDSKETGDTLAGSWGILSALPGHPMMWILIVSEILVFGGALIGEHVGSFLWTVLPKV